MINFVRSGGPIPADHLTDIIAYFDGRGVDYAVYNRLCASEVTPGDAYVTCDMNVDATLDPVRDSVYQVQISHNLTGLKGSPFGRSRADLNIVPGVQTLEAAGVEVDDERFVIGGYPKWDRIYPERFRIEERRRAIASSHGVDPGTRWVCYYPTGPNAGFRGNAGKTARILNRLQADLPGEFHLFFIDHAHNAGEVETRHAVEDLGVRAEIDSRLTVVEGAHALPYITACELFITDIASAVLTALSMDKPTLFVDIQLRAGDRSAVERFQCGPYLHEIPSLADYIESYSPPASLRSLFLRCIEHDDDENCRRITELVLDSYASWREAH